MHMRYELTKEVDRYNKTRFVVKCCYVDMFPTPVRFSPLNSTIHTITMNRSNIKYKLIIDMKHFLKDFIITEGSINLH